MKGALILLAHSFKRLRTLVLIMGTVLAVFQIFLILIARSIERSNTFDQMSALIPPFVRQLMGPSFTSFMSFRGIVSLGYFHLAVMGSLIALAIAIATMPASEIEMGYMDLMLARPIARHWVITRSIAMLLICELFLFAMMMMGTWIGLNLLAQKIAAWPQPDFILLLVLNLGLLLICWGGVALAIGARSRRRGMAGSITGLLALVTFLLDYVARAWQPAEAVAWLSPFKYFNPLELLMGRDIPPHNLWVLAGIGLAGFILAYIFFSRRDI